MKRMQKQLFPLLALSCILLMCGWFLGRGSADGVTLHTQRAASVEDAAPNRSTPAVASSAAARRLDLNRATAEELTTLPGIGQVRAERIVAYRSEHGPFRTTADLMQIEGIGEAIYAGLRDLIYVEEDHENPDY